MLARNASFTVIDFETTGAVEGYPVSPWQVGMVRMAGGTVAGGHLLSSLINVGDRPFNPYAPGRHAALREEILAAPGIHDLWGVFDHWLSGRPLVAHNAATERKCLGEAFPLHTFGPWIDTLALARVAYPEAPSHQLGDVIAMLGLECCVEALCPGLEAHDALYDACASGVLLEHFLGLPGWEEITIGNLASARPARYHRRRKNGTRL